MVAFNPGIDEDPVAWLKDWSYMTLRPTDILILRPARKLSAEEIERMYLQLSKLIENKVIIVPADMEVGILENYTVSISDIGWSAHSGDEVADEEASSDE